MFSRVPIKERSMRASGITLAAAAVAVASGFAGSQGNSHYYICSTRDAAKKVGYVSNVFADVPGDLGAIEAQWKAMLTAKYGSMPFPSNSCQETTSNAAATTAREKLYDFMNDEGQKVTQTSWSYSASAPPVKGGKAAPPAVATNSADPDHAEEWCKYNMPQIRTLFTCPCFAKIVAEHRARYPNEVLIQEGGQKIRLPFQQNMAGTPTRLDCKECMTDEHIAKWIEEQRSDQKLILTRMGKWDAAAQSKFDAMNACIAKTFKRNILAEPYVDIVIPMFNRASAECAGSRP
jgi:hypothetical protein